MTDDPRYAPRPQPPGWQQQYPARQYPARQPNQRPYQQPYDWRHVQQPQSPYDTASTAVIPVVQPVTRPMVQPATRPAVIQPVTHAVIQPPPRRRSRAGWLFAGAIALSVVSATVGGVTAVLVQSHHPLSTMTAVPVNGAPPQRSPQGSVEQGAAKV